MYLNTVSRYWIVWWNYNPNETAFYETIKNSRGCLGDGYFDSLIGSMENCVNEVLETKKYYMLFSWYLIKYLVKNNNIWLFRVRSWYPDLNIYFDGWKSAGFFVLAVVKFPNLFLRLAFFYALINGVLGLFQIDKCMKTPKLNVSQCPSLMCQPRLVALLILYKQVVAHLNKDLMMNVYEQKNKIKKRTKKRTK